MSQGTPTLDASAYGSTSATAPLASASAAPTTTPATAADKAPRQSFTRRLDAGEELWIWKYGLRALAIIVAIIGTGCVAWAVTTTANGPYAYELDDHWSIVWSLITFGISAIWCAICIIVFLLRRSHSPVHPGVAVGIDLVLWLAFIPTAMFMLIGALSVIGFGSDGVIGNYSSYGRYEQAANGTWIWNQTEYDSYRGRDRDCSVGGRYSRYDSYGFDSCAEEDAYVNALWQAKPHRVGVEVTGVVCQFLGLFLHLTLFIWACVDTHRRNARKVSKDAEKLAANIVMNMIQSGAVVPAQHNQGMQQPLLHPQYAHVGPPSGWMPAGPAPMGQAVPMMTMPPQAFVRGPEKSDAPRFA